MIKRWVLVSISVISAVVVFIAVLLIYFRENISVNNNIDTDYINNTPAVLNNVGISSADDLAWQGFSSSELGIRFSFPSIWNRPMVLHSGTESEILFDNDVVIYIGKGSGDSSSKLSVETITGKGEIIIINYNDDDDSKVIEEIINSIEDYNPPTLQPEPPVTASINDNPSSAPTIAILPTNIPTPDPTLFYQSGENCTYGCVNRNKFQ